MVTIACCTIFGAAAQVFIKIGMSPEHFVGTIPGLLTNYPLIAGYGLYGLFTIAMVLSLKHGELSKLYPIIALTYVWVTLASYAFLHDTPNRYKNLGIATIVLGVAVLGGGEHK